MEYTVKQVAQRVELPSRTVRYYDRIGLVVPRTRSAAGYRLYAPEDEGRPALRAPSQVARLLAGRDPPDHRGRRTRRLRRAGPRARAPAGRQGRPGRRADRRPARVSRAADRLPGAATGLLRLPERRSSAPDQTEGSDEHGLSVWLQHHRDHRPDDHRREGVQLRLLGHLSRRRGLQLWRREARRRPRAPDHHP